MSLTVTVDNDYEVSVSNFAFSTITLGSLKDVDVSSVSDGQMLTYDASSSSWKPSSSSSGSGDMLKSVYDTDNSGVVDDSEKLNSQLPSYYLDRSNHTGTQLSSSISDFDSGVSSNSDVSANTTHRGVTSGNPHNVTKSDVGLGNVVNLDTSNASNITSGTLPSSVLPPVALTTVQTASSESEMLSLTTEEGDVVVRTDLSKSFMRNSGSSGTISDFTELQTPTDSVLSVNSKTGTVVLTQDDVGDGSTYVRTANDFTSAEKSKLSGIESGAEVNVNADWNSVSGDSQILNKPSTFPPSSHTHVESEITDLSHDAVKIMGVNVDSSVGTPSDGDILVYRSAGSDFVLEAKPAGGSNPALNDVTDVTISSVSDNEVLAYDSGSSEWINQTPSEAGLASATHTHTSSDVSDFDTAVSNNSAVVANTAKVTESTTVSAPLSLSGYNVSIPKATGSVDGYLSSVDWNTFNNKLSSYTETDPVYSASQASNITATDITNLSNLSGVNTGDQTITLTGDVTGSGTGSFVTTISNGAVDIAMFSAAGTPSSSTYLRGDNTWATPTSGISNVVDDTTPQLGGNLEWNSKGLFLSGQTAGGINGDLVYLSGSNTWSQADADAEVSSKGMLGIRISSTTVLTHGVYTTSGLTAGSVYYVSATAGGITSTAPSSSGQFVRVIGYALSSTELFFDPDKTWVEIA